MTPSDCADVTVIIPAWRAAETIRRALASVARQTVRPSEVVVVDDGSDDGTSDAARAMAADLSPTALKVIRQENSGPGAARNRAICEASGSVLAFLDADDEWLPEKLETSLSALRDGIVLVAHNITTLDDSGVQPFDCARHLPAGTDAFVALFKRGFVSTATVVCRAETVRAAGGFDETLRSGQDYELWLRIAKAHPMGFAVLPGFLTRYHVLPGSVSSRVGLRRRCSIEIARRHAPALRGRTSNPISVAGLRIAFITAEAFISYRHRRDWLSAFAVAASLPWTLAVVVFGYVRSRGANGGPA